jgi:hypothetical protein
MSTTAIAAALMMAYAGVAELPAWMPGAQYISPVPPAPATETIVPKNTCPIPGTELVAGGRRCVPDCRQGPCKRVRVAEEQTTFRDAQGRTTGRSSTGATGATRFWDAQGRSTGTATGPRK